MRMTRVTRLEDAVRWPESRTLTPVAVIEGARCRRGLPDTLAVAVTSTARAACFVLGAEIAGVVRSAPDSSQVVPGDRDCRPHVTGGMAEKSLSPERVFNCRTTLVSGRRGRAVQRPDGRFAGGQGRHRQ